MSTDDGSSQESERWQAPGGQPAIPGYQPPAGYPLGASSRPPAPSFPAAPLGSTPTPRPSPMERLRDTRGGATSGKRATAHPDGAPSPIPRTTALRANTPRTTGAAPAGTQVVQRFSGTGLTPRPVVARREDRARRTTLALASAAVLLLVVSALALFDPSTHFAGFGFALGQRVTQVKSDVPLILQGTEPPTPTAGDATVSPTATPNNGTGTSPTATATSGPQPTATAQATATAQPTATATPVPTATPLPTATATVLPTSAQVTFNAAKQTVQSQPSTISSCPSGCDFGDKLVSGSQQFSHSASAVYSYTVTVSWTGTVEFDLNGCQILNQSCRYINNNASVNGCGPYRVDVGFAGGPARQTFSCTRSTNPGNVNVQNWQFNGNATVGYKMYNFNPNNVDYYTVSNAACQSALQNADSQGSNWATGYINSANSGQQVVSMAQVNHNGYGCSPGVGYTQAWGFNFTGSSTTNVYGGVDFDKSVALNIASSRVALPPGYVWSGSLNTCGMTWAASGNTVTITCQDSRAAAYDWGSSSQGQTAQTTLKGKLAGLSLSAAQSLCNGNYPGISPGSCTITLTGGNVNILPGAASITIVAN